MATLEEYLVAGAEGDLVPWPVQRSAMEVFGFSCARVEEAILSMGLLPARYQRNRQTIHAEGQLRLFRSKVAVVGCGGLGGYIIEQLARLGVGSLVVVDPDVFEEHNLNRQLLSSLDGLGKSKVAAAVARVGGINPAVTVTPYDVAFSAANGAELFDGVQLVVDALDSIPVRLELADVCRRLELPLVHGAIGGWYGHVATQFPGEKCIESIYRNWASGKGMEQQLGNPSFTPAVVASMQVAEACKLLLGETQLLRGRILSVDLLSMEFHVMEM
ncbi:MAG TPA: HesA/MoeB/ThiF family protein [Geobacteraceae bacterium]|nr:HesA/MoeB/ThiF family protein [Geobacteraceae bacterium]